MSAEFWQRGQELKQ